jgi:hypothetical protein
LVVARQTGSDDGQTRGNPQRPGTQFVRPLGVEPEQERPGEPVRGV